MTGTGGEGLAVPGDEMPATRSGKNSPRNRRIQFAAALVFGLAGVIAMVKAVVAAYVTFATNDYRPILIGGVWACAAALICLQAVTALVRSWKTKWAAFVCTFAVLRVLSDLLRRF